VQEYSARYYRIKPKTWKLEELSDALTPQEQSSLRQILPVGESTRIRRQSLFSQTEICVPWRQTTCVNCSTEPAVKDPGKTTCDRAVVQVIGPGKTTDAIAPA
jgi:hypothetical protein